MTTSAAGKNLNKTLENLNEESAKVLKSTDSLLAKLETLTTSSTEIVDENKTEIKDFIDSLKEISNKVDKIAEKTQHCLR